MIELVDTFPDTNVQPAEYKRLLGFPRDYVLDALPRERAEAARAWYGQNGRPWVYAREVQSLDFTGDAVVIDGASFTSKRLRQTLQRAEAHSAILVAVSAGPEIEQAAAAAWAEERPDEYFFLEVYGSAVVEHLTATVGARLCGWADGHGIAVLPHHSPGYAEWDVAEQPRLLELIRRTPQHHLPGPLESLESGMLRPKKSLLAVFGLTRQTERVARLTDLVPCTNCSLAACQYRRVAYRRSTVTQELEPATTAAAVEDQPATEPPSPVPSLDDAARYLTNTKALRRWADERLTLGVRDDGTIEALFRYEGTTCSNMGRAVRFHYTVTLGPREQGYPILASRCDPAPGDDGYRFMCRYMNNAEHLMVAIDHEKPLLGQPLNDLLAWQRPATGAGCYCEPTSRKHKWGLVLETIHYALVQREKQLAPKPLVREGAATP
jgi:hypothetical protein